MIFMDWSGYWEYNELKANAIQLCVSHL